MFKKAAHKLIHQGALLLVFLFSAVLSFSNSYSSANPYNTDDENISSFVIHGTHHQSDVPEVPTEASETNSAEKESEDDNDDDDKFNLSALSQGLDSEEQYFHGLDNVFLLSSTQNRPLYILLHSWRSFII